MAQMQGTVPFLSHAHRDAIVARHGGQDISRARFVGDIMALAAILPPGKHMINLCADRYFFTVGMGAALVKGQISLLPPSGAPVELQQLADAYEDLYILTDKAGIDFPAPVLRIPHRLPPRSVETVPAFSPDQEAVILFTSGSTGQPKPQLKSWGALVASTKAMGAGLGISALKGAALLGTVPFQHSYGLESTVMLALQHELVLTATRPFFPADVISAIEEFRCPRILVTTPVHLRALLVDESAMPKIDLMVSATAPLSQDLALQAEAAFNGPLLEIYGCSEAGQIAHRHTASTIEWQVMQGMALHQSNGATYVCGEPIVSAPVPLSDEIELLDATRFILHGRTADLVNIAGKRSALSFLNAHLNAIDGVVDGVFVMPEEKDGAVARLMAFVVAPGLSVDTILNALRQRIDPAFLPRPLCLIDALPRNALGKLLREDLRKLTERANVD